jgi:adenosine deaminase
VDFSVLPKVVLHEHLDGGLRAATLLDLADAVGYEGLPASNAEGIAAAFYQGESRSLPGYLAAFGHTIAVMQTGEALERVATEAVEDLAADGVVYAEIRFAPSLHTERGLDRDTVLDAVLHGVSSASTAAGITARVLVDAMRQDGDSAAVAAAAVRFAGRGVVGFDLAGPEAGFPASDHAAACVAAVAGGLRLTIHAGEADGPNSIADAMAVGAERLGHGVRIIEDCEIRDGEIVLMGPIATDVFERGLPLEVCPTSNVHTLAAPSFAEHPLGMLHRAGFAVTLNTDNRLMSATSMTGEFEVAAEHHGFEVADLRQVTLTAVDAAFCGEQTRASVRERIEAGYPEP